MADVTFVTMSIDGNLNWLGVLPASQEGPEAVAYTTTFTEFRARRGIPGSSGTTTIQLEVNGIAQTGATLSWTFSDGAFLLKQTSIGVLVVAGDIISLKVLEIEGGNPADILAEVNT